MIDVVAAQPAHDFSQQEAFFTGCERCDQRADLVSAVITLRRLQAIGHCTDRLFPGDRLQCAIAITQQRLRCTVFGIETLMTVPIPVGQPVLVDRIVVLRHDAQHFTTARMQEQVRAKRVVITDRFPRDQFPGTRLEPERLVGQRANRADINDVAAEFGLDRLADVGPDLGVFAAANAAKLTGAGNFTHEAHAARAMDAAGHVGRDQRPDVLVGNNTLALDKPRHRTPVAHGDVLQFALAALVADGAIERMIDQQELHHVAL